MSDRQIKGLVCGKFYPLHKGHDFLITTAMRNCNHLTIMVVQQPDQQPSGELREKWITKAYPEVTVILVDDIYKDGDHQAWAEFTINTLGYVPDIVFSSENYGKPWSKAMKSDHMLVDLNRKKFSISGREIRRSPDINREFLNSEVRAYYEQIN